MLAHNLKTILPEKGFEWTWLCSESLLNVNRFNFVLLLKNNWSILELLISNLSTIKPPCASLWMFAKKNANAMLYLKYSFILFVTVSIAYHGFGFSYVCLKGRLVKKSKLLLKQIHNNANF